MEEWRPVAGYNRYEVSNLGRVRSWCAHGGGRSNEPRILSPNPNRDGYPRVNIAGGRTRFVHHLVLEAFVGQCPPGQQCCHWDDNPRNDRLDNLRWDTVVANASDRVRNGGTIRGEVHQWARLTEGDVHAMRSDYAAGVGPRALARAYGVTRAQAQNIVHRRAWAHVE